MSSFFNRLILLNTNMNPIVVLSSEVSFKELEALIEYCYTGTCLVLSDNIDEFLKIGKNLEIRGLVEESEAEDPNNNSSFINIPETPSATPLVLMDLTLEENLPPQKVAKPENNPASKIIPETSKKAPKVKRERTERALKIRLPSSQLLQVKQKTKRKALAPADENAQPKPKVSKTAETSEKLQLKCQFCPRVYTNKTSRNTHQRECDNNPSKVEIECSICHEIMKVKLCNKVLCTVSTNVHSFHSQPIFAATRRSTPRPTMLRKASKYFINSSENLWNKK